MKVLKVDKEDVFRDVITGEARRRGINGNFPSASMVTTFKVDGEIQFTVILAEDGETDDDITAFVKTWEGNYVEGTCRGS